VLYSLLRVSCFCLSQRHTTRVPGRVPGPDTRPGHPGPATHDPGARAGHPGRVSLTPGQSEKSIALQCFLTARPGQSARVSLDPAARAAQHRIVI